MTIASNDVSHLDVDAVQVETGLREVLELLAQEGVSLLVVVLSVSGDHDERVGCIVRSRPKQAL